uniref:Transposase n=1 Tax=Rodentolepis nana TaxID=102285 RepID=A0A0R3TI26_RODNA
LMPSFPQYRLKRNASPGDDTARGLVAPVNPIQEASSGHFDATFDRILSPLFIIMRKFWA